MKKMILWESVLGFYRLLVIVTFNKDKTLDLVELRSETKLHNDKRQTSSSFFINKNESVKMFNFISDYLK